jgi:hypothetical protein
LACALLFWCFVGFTLGTQEILRGKSGDGDGDDDDDDSDDGNNDNDNDDDDDYQKVRVC